jgi:uncharacterized lipoprotein
MNKFWWTMAVLVPVVALQGCSLKTQNLRVDPEVKVKESKVGEGTTVGLKVTDGRDSPKLGEVGDPNTKMVDVVIEQDPSPKVYERVKEALEKMGFTVVPQAEGSDPSLSIDIRKLQLQSEKTPFTFETELRAEVAAHAARTNGRYDRQFNVRTRRDGAGPPYEKDSTALVNTALSQALEDLLADEQLIGMLKN